ncbi:hypothetical protein [Pseudomonas sp.]|uniref:hypothetical protein n=1 Tax=Pseudomonas sp. TaxID=306 RepID=UPI003CC6386C
MLDDNNDINNAFARVCLHKMLPAIDYIAANGYLLMSEQLAKWGITDRVDSPVPLPALGEPVVRRPFYESMWWMITPISVFWHGSPGPLAPPLSEGALGPAPTCRCRRLRWPCASPKNPRVRSGQRSLAAATRTFAAAMSKKSIATIESSDCSGMGAGL